MKGIAGTMLRLLYVSRLQRWLAGIGLVPILFALAAQAGGWHPDTQPLFALAGVLGIITVVVSPVVVGPLLFRSLCAPRTVALIPHGRLKLVLGALCSQLLLATFIGAGFALLNPHGAAAAAGTGALTGTVTVTAFGALTVFFMVFSWSMRYRLAPLIWVPFVALPQIITFVFPHLNLGTRMTTPGGLGVVFAASLLTWLVFGVAVVSSRRTRLPLWNTVGLGARAGPTTPPSAATRHEPVNYTTGTAIRILLAGNVNMRWGLCMVVVFLGVMFLLLAVMTANAPHSGGNPAIFFAFMICLSAAIVPGAFSAMMVRRARLLWLASGKGRAQLFATIELHSWRMICFACGAAMLMALPLVLFGTHSRPALITLLTLPLLPLSCGSAIVYVGLLYVRGNRFGDILILAANTILLLVVTFSAASESRAFPSLIGIQIILVPVLRQIARGRWSQIDWLLLRQPLAAARIA